jgi:hypothetical protein
MLVAYGGQGPNLSSPQRGRFYFPGQTVTGPTRLQNKWNTQSDRWSICDHHVACADTHARGGTYGQVEGRRTKQTCLGLQHRETDRNIVFRDPRFDDGAGFFRCIVRMSGGLRATSSRAARTLSA